jgi:multisubunit Na+/H+ antiporter MnhE subunit
MCLDIQKLILEIDNAIWWVIEPHYNLKTLSMTMKTSFITLAPGGAEAEVEDARLALKIHWL